MTMQDTINQFLEDFDRQEWMQAHGKWASEDWDEGRVVYDGALVALRDAVRELPDGDESSAESAASELQIEKLATAVAAAAAALEDQVTPDESDYIQEGTIDPDDVAAEAHEVGLSADWEGWDCREGWKALRFRNDLYICWWRAGYGNRRSRELYVLVENEYFQEQEQ